MKLSVLLLSLVISCHVIAATSITTPTVSGHWTLAGSPYNIYNNIEISNATSLTIDPGVDVVFHGAFRLQVKGILNASGTSAAPINFYVNDTTGFSTDLSTTVVVGGWHGIQFLPYSGTATDTSILKYCDISYIKFDSLDYYTPSLNALLIQRNLKVVNCNFHDNNALYPMPVNFISILYNYAVEIANCNFYNFRSVRSIIINTYNAHVNFHDSKMYDNESESYFINVNNGSLKFVNNEIYNNNAPNSVSAIGVLTVVSNATIKGNIIHDNTMGNDAAVSCFGGFINIIGNRIYNNYHVNGLCGYVDGGGALNLSSNSGSNYDSTYYNVRNNIISNNYSPYEGGGIKILNANAKITNNQIISNRSTGGAAISINDQKGSTIAIKNNIFYGNSSDTSSTSALITPTVKSPSLDHTHIIYDHNWQQNFTQKVLNVAGIAYTVTGDSTTNIIGTAPGLVAASINPGVSPAAGTANFDLLPASSCINKGDTAGVVVDSFDFAGLPRLSGIRIDIGAYEYQFPAPADISATTAVAREMKVYPNPAHDLLYISIPDATGVIEILDIYGRLLLKKEAVSVLTSIDVHALAHGIYFITWYDMNNLREVRKILVE